MNETRPHAAPSAPRDTRAVLVALLVGGAVILAVGHWAGKRQAENAAFTPAPPAPLLLSAPADGDTVRGPALVLRFRTEAPLEATPAGWAAGPWHLHAFVDGVEHMPAAADLERTGPGRYAWRLRVAPGTHALRLAWSSREHVTLGTGASAEVTVHVVEAPAGERGDVAPQ